MHEGVDRSGRSLRWAGPFGSVCPDHSCSINGSEKQRTGTGRGERGKNVPTLELLLKLKQDGNPRKSLHTESRNFLKIQEKIGAIDSAVPGGIPYKSKASPRRARDGFLSPSSQRKEHICLHA